MCVQGVIEQEVKAETSFAWDFSLASEVHVVDGVGATALVVMGGCMLRSSLKLWALRVGCGGVCACMHLLVTSRVEGGVT